MRQTVLWPWCFHCNHRVNPRSETCEERHLMCTPDGCVVGDRGWPAVPAAPFEAPAALAAVPRAASQTTFLVDLASYQAGIDLAAVKAAGYTMVNIKLSQGDWYVHAGAATFARQARDLGMGICTFHWLDNSASGTAQADFMWRRMQAIGGPAGVAHQCDCEDSARPATFEVWRDYMRRVTGLLGRPVVNYTGDWWWMPRGWVGQPESPYLWAGPNAGYLASYPGDTSSHWQAGYGGWTNYAMLQYAVQPVANAGGGNLSKTATRDPAVWAALTGTGEADMDATQAQQLRTIHDILTSTDNRLKAHAHVREAWMMDQLADLVDRPAGGFTDEQVDRLAAALIARPDNPLGDADQPAIRAALHAELANLTLRAGQEG